MSDDELDPGASTQMFQAFVDAPEPEASRSPWLWAGLGALTLVIVFALVWLALGG